MAVAYGPAGTAADLPRLSGEGPGLPAGLGRSRVGPRLRTPHIDAIVDVLVAPSA